MMKIFKKLFRNQLEPEDALKLQASAGDSFGVFKRSDVGQYLIARVNHEHECVVKEIISANPTDDIKIIQLQERAKLLGDFLGWITNAINEGEMAKYQLHEFASMEKDY